jgi:hypothetical protein
MDASRVAARLKKSSAVRVRSFAAYLVACDFFVLMQTHARE